MKHVQRVVFLHSQTQRLLYLSVLPAAIIILPKPEHAGLFYLNERIFRNGRLHSDGDACKMRADRPRATSE